MCTYLQRPSVVLLQAILSLGFWTSTCQGEDCFAQAWQGTIGQTPVMMEFDNVGEDEALAGRYYYRTGMTDLLLQEDAKKKGLWRELDPKGKVTGLLSLTCQNNAVSGEWKSPNGKTVLPIRAEPATSYSDPRLDAAKPRVIKRGATRGHQYEIIGVPGIDAVQGLRLLGDTNGIQKINATLRNQFLSDLERATTCVSYGRLKRGQDHGYEHEAQYEVIAWNGNFVVIGSGESGYCGGAHPYVEHGAMTYSLQSGEVEDVSLWLMDRYREDIALDTGLGKLLLKSYRAQQTEDDDQCPDYIEFSGSAVWPTDQGFIFFASTPYAQSACRGDIAVPYKAVLPYLSPDGRSRVGAFSKR